MWPRAALLRIAAHFAGKMNLAKGSGLASSSQVVARRGRPSTKRPLILDGEAVYCDNDGATSFEKLLSLMESGIHTSITAHDRR
jgi:hypothetical protein